MAESFQLRWPRTTPSTIPTVPSMASAAPEGEQDEFRPRSEEERRALDLSSDDEELATRLPADLPPLPPVADNETATLPPPPGVMWLYPLPELGFRAAQVDLILPSSHVMVEVCGCDGHGASHWAIARHLTGDVVHTVLAWVMGVRSLEFHLFFGPSFDGERLIPVKKLDSLLGIREQGFRTGCRIWLPVPGASRDWPGFPHLDLLFMWAPLSPSPFDKEIQPAARDVVVDESRFEMVHLSLSPGGNVQRTLRRALTPVEAKRERDNREVQLLILASQLRERRRRPSGARSSARSRSR